MKIKNTLNQYLIEGAARMLMDGQIFVDAKMFVQDLMDTNLSNAEKHHKAKENLIHIFGEIGNTLLDIAIKLAVLWVKYQAQSENNEV